MQVIRGSISNNNMNYYCNWMNIIAAPRINGYMYYILRSCNGNNETPHMVDICNITLPDHKRHRQHRLDIYNRLGKSVTIRELI